MLNTIQLLYKPPHNSDVKSQPIITQIKLLKVHLGEQIYNEFTVDFVSDSAEQFDAAYSDAQSDTQLKSFLQTHYSQKKEGIAQARALIQLGMLNEALEFLDTIRVPQAVLNYQNLFVESFENTAEAVFWYKDLAIKLIGGPRYQFWLRFAIQQPAEQKYQILKLMHTQAPWHLSLKLLLLQTALLVEVDPIPIVNKIAEQSGPRFQEYVRLISGQVLKSKFRKKVEAIALIGGQDLNADRCLQMVKYLPRPMLIDSWHHIAPLLDGKNFVLQSSKRLVKRIEKIVGVQIEKQNGTVAIVYKEIKFLIEQSQAKIQPVQTARPQDIKLQNSNLEVHLNTLNTFTFYLINPCVLKFNEIQAQVQPPFLCKIISPNGEQEWIQNQVYRLEIYLYSLEQKIDKPLYLTISFISGDSCLKKKWQIPYKQLVSFQAQGCDRVIVLDAKLDDAAKNLKIFGQQSDSKFILKAEAAQWITGEYLSETETRLIGCEITVNPFVSDPSPEQSSETSSEDENLTSFQF